MEIRVGIHYGEIISVKNDIYGDNVNIASRLESIAPAGGVLISKNVYDELINKDLEKFMQHTIGEYRFGSIDEFENGLADSVYYNNSAGTSIPSDASQEFTYGTHTFYIQDEKFLDSLSMEFYKTIDDEINSLPSIWDLNTAPISISILVNFDKDII